ncbi:MAG: hypothetical protein HRU15_03130 [Planctomycetes bacterium]|nr:hypothetical protein [Planctomycetota bacterium]
MPPWNGKAKASACGDITSKTKLSAPDGTSDSRLTIGIGEFVDFEATESVEWKATRGEPIEARGKVFNWESSCHVGSTTITAKFPDGSTCSIEINSIEPEDVSYIRIARMPVPAGQQGAGMKLKIILLPLNVNFSYLKFREQPNKATKREGFWDTLPEGRPFHVHGSIFDWVEIGDIGNKVSGTDTASAGPYEKIVTGKFTWTIPCEYKCFTTEVEFIKKDQDVVMRKEDAYCSVEKGNEFVQNPR